MVASPHRRFSRLVDACSRCQLRLARTARRPSDWRSRHRGLTRVRNIASSRRCRLNSRHGPFVPFVPFVLDQELPDTGRRTRSLAVPIGRRESPGQRSQSPARPRLLWPCSMLLPGAAAATRPPLPLLCSVEPPTPVSCCEPCPCHVVNPSNGTPVSCCELAL